MGGLLGKFMAVAPVVLGWLMRAAADGRITAAECIALVQAIIAATGLDLEIELDDFNRPEARLDAVPELPGSGRRGLSLD